jgi:hypothetical protein
VVRNPKRTEAGIQADVRQFILSAPFELEPGDLNDVSLESPVGDRRRIDVEAGSTVIEVKRDLRKEKSKRDAEKQLAGYVEFRMQQTGLRYVGVLTTVRNRSSRRAGWTPWRRHREPLTSGRDRRRKTASCLTRRAPRTCRTFVREQL